MQAQSCPLDHSEFMGQDWLYIMPLASLGPEKTEMGSDSRKTPPTHSVAWAGPRPVGSTMRKPHG